MEWADLIIENVAAVMLDDDFPPSHKNAAIAYFLHDLSKVRDALVYFMIGGIEKDIINCNSLTLEKIKGFKVIQVKQERRLSKVKLVVE